MNVTIQLKGFAELAAKLREMPDNINRNALRSAVGAGAAAVRDETKFRAPVETGTLKRAIYIKQIREKSSLTQQTFYVGARQGQGERKVGKKGLNRDAYYARWVEGGHKIVARFKKKYESFKLRGRGRLTGLVLRRAQSTGRVRPHRFLAPAFESKRQAAIDAMAAKLRERIERYRQIAK